MREKEMSENEHKHTITKADCILIALLLLIAAALLFSLNRFRTPGTYVDVMVDGASVKTFPLDEDAHYTLTGDAGSNTIVIKDSAVSVEAADCPDKMCVEHKTIQNVGETIICLPHNMVVDIKKKNNK